MKTRLISVLATLGLLSLVASGLDLAQGRVPLPLARVAEAAGCPPDVVFGCLLTGSGAHGWRANNNTTAVAAAGVVGQITSTAPGARSAGVRGINNATTVQGYGVYGSHAGGGHGVLGTTVSGMGVYGSATGGTGVYGRHANTTGAAPGVQGDTSSRVDQAVGVLGQVTSTSAGYDSAGVKGVNNGTFSVNYGVLGISASEEGSGVSGQAPYRGVSGQASGVGGAGVYGSAGFAGGAAYGVFGETFSSSAEAAGVLGLFANQVAGQKAAGVRGIMNATQGSAQGAGVWGSSSTYGRGVYGESTNGNGVYGESTNGNGVYGYAMRAHAVIAWGHGGSLDRAALKAVASQVQGGYAANFDGKIYVKSGIESAAPQSLLLDHPLDPANQYLSHAAMTSPELKNVYDGVVTLDNQGEAWVQLPAYFEALNRDFRYQLTAIGAAAPNLHVAAKIAGNRFKIAGGAPGMEVSWQVTGLRNDPYARQHPHQAEKAKAEAERGKYVYPEAYGQPETLGLGYEAPPAVEDAPLAVPETSP